MDSIEKKKKAIQEITISPQYEDAFGILGKKWQALIIDVLYQKNCTFSDISRAIITISDRMLTGRLKELEKEGIVEK